MANPNKVKGDRAERAAVEALRELAADLVLPDAQRMLGAGRRDDIGDLRVFPDAAVQVRAMRNLAAGVRSAAFDAEVQAARGRSKFPLGMVPIPHAPNRPDAVRWLAATTQWPTHLDESTLPSWGNTGLAIKWLRLRPTTARPDVLPIDARLARIERRGADTFYLATLQTWVAAYRSARSADQNAA